MKNIKTNNINIYLTLTFYLGLILVPIFLFSGDAIGRHLLNYVKTSPLNYLFHISPVVIMFFVRKKTKKHSTKILIFLYSLLTVFVYFEYSRAIVIFSYAIIGILLLSVVLLNTDSVLAECLVLIPGLFLNTLGAGYILTAYVPVFLLMLMKNSENGKTDRKLSLIIMGAYLYTILLTVLFAIKGRLNFSLNPISFRFDIPVFTVSFISGAVLILLGCILFITTAFSATKKSDNIQRISAFLFAVYPIVYCVLGCLMNVFLSDFRTVFLVAMLMYIVGNIQLCSSYPEKTLSIIPEKHKNAFYFISATLLCIFIFPHF